MWEPAMTGTAKIFRVLLEVNDLDLSLRFYETLLAASGRRVGGGRVYFDCGPVILALVDATAGGAGQPSAIPEPLYLATSDLEGIHRLARQLGCLSTELIHNDPENPAGEITVRPWGERSFYVDDPSGNSLCFVDERTLYTGTPEQVAALEQAMSRSRDA